MRKLPVLILSTFVLLLSTALGGVVVENTAGHVLDTSVWNTLDLRTDAIIDIWDAPNDTIVFYTDASSSSWWEEKPTPETHYIDGYDTTIVYDRIECDTNYFRADYTDSLGRMVYEREVSCDTVFVLEVKPKWKKKITVLLTPMEIERLKAILNSGKEEYGVKE